MTKQKYKRQPRKFYERPLTAEEAQFAADHLSLVYWFLNKHGLNENEWFDVVIFGYMMAVKKYVSIPDLKQYSFTTTAYKAMSSAVSNERKNQEKQIKTVSLYDPAPGTDDLVYADMVTAENLNFVAYLEGGEDVKVTYNVPLPKSSAYQSKCEETLAIEKFLGSDKENMCLEYETAREADLKSKTVRSHRNRLAKLHIYYEAHLRGNRIYITKGKETRAI